MLVVPIQDCGSLREEHEEREQTFCYLFIIALHTSQQPGEESSCVHNTPFASTLLMGLHKPRRLLT